MTFLFIELPRQHLKNCWPKSARVDTLNTKGRLMRLPNTDPTVEISTTSGILRVEVRPSRSWPALVVELLVIGGFAALTYQNWAKMSPLLHVLFVIALASGILGLIFQFSGVEILKIDSDKITLSKGVHGWERKREYENKRCRELEWMEGGEDTPRRLQFKTDWRAIAFCENLTENQAIQILTALQEILPSVAQQLCSYPEGKKHFLTLGLS